MMIAALRGCTDFSISGESVPITLSTSLSIIDTGTTLIGGPSADVRRLWATVPAAQALGGVNSGLYAMREFFCCSKLILRESDVRVCVVIYSVYDATQYIDRVWWTVVADRRR
jgi:hypothetical protein